MVERGWGDVGVAWRGAGVCGCASWRDGCCDGFVRSDASGLVRLGVCVPIDRSLHLLPLSR